MAVAHRADKAAHRTHTPVARPQGLDLGGEVKVRGLNRDALGHTQPPVTGGKKATSQPSLKAWSSALIT